MRVPILTRPAIYGCQRIVVILRRRLNCSLLTRLVHFYRIKLLHGHILGPFPYNLFIHIFFIELKLIFVLFRVLGV